MHKKNVTANLDIRQIFFDVLTLLAAYFCALVIYEKMMGKEIGGTNFWIYITYSFTFILCMLQNRMYNVTTFYYYDRLIIRILTSSLCAGLSLSMIIFLSKTENASRLLFLVFICISVAMITAQRLLLRWLAHFESTGSTRVLFIGNEKALESYKAYLEKTAMKFTFVSVCGYDDPSVSTVKALAEHIVALHVDEVHIVCDMRTTPIDFEACSLACEDMGITSRLIMDFYELPNSKKFVSSVGPYPVLTYHSISFDKVQLFFKRIVDLVGAIAGLIMTAPIFLVTAIAIKLDSPGPVLFKQKRAGLNGRIFNMYKFRSMYIDAEERKQGLMAQNKIAGGLMFKMDNDPRITRVGRFIRRTSIDELPQLINVLKNDMSLVGTRPPTLDEVQKYTHKHRRRISIMPGITGMWQVNGRSDILDFEQVVELDVQYINNWTLALDFKLIFLTFAAVLTHRGAA